MEILETLDKMARPWPTLAKGISILEPEITKSLLALKVLEGHVKARDVIVRNILRISDWRISVGHSIGSFEKYFFALFISPLTSTNHYSLRYSIDYDILDSIISVVLITNENHKKYNLFQVGKDIEKFYMDVSNMLSINRITPAALSGLLNYFGE